MTRIGACLRAVLFVVAVLISGRTDASAQMPRAEVSGGVGYAAARGEPPPNLVVVGAGAAMWLSTRFGVSWGVSWGPGEKVDQSPASGGPAAFPQHVGDRKSLTSGRLLLQRATVRYRHPVGKYATFVGGGGFLLRGQYRQTDLVADTLTETRTIHYCERWAGLSYELLIQVSASRRLSFQTGLVTDFALDSFYYQPVVRLSLGF
jgi:hypothetical protein